MKNGENLESAEVRSAKRQHDFRIEDKAAFKVRPAAAASPQMFLACSVLLDEECVQPRTVFSKLYCAVCSSFTD